MAKITFHDFVAIHNALNDMIIAEVKAALALLPGKSIESKDSPCPMCRIVVSSGSDYRPCDLSVRRVWLDDSGRLNMEGRPYSGSAGFTETYDEDDDMLDITDFKYLIEQIAAQAERDGHYVLPNQTLQSCGYVPELALIHEADKLITV